MGLTLDITTTGSIIKSILVESCYEQEYFPPSGFSHTTHTRTTNIYSHLTMFAQHCSYRNNNGTIAILLGIKHKI